MLQNGDCGHEKVAQYHLVITPSFSLPGTSQKKRFRTPAAVIISVKVPLVPTIITNEGERLLTSAHVIMI